jgi:predicted AlkP superfamily phosphohydrolase/phosphomutase
MPANLLVISFDSLEATLVDRWIDEGLLPTFAELRRRGAEIQLDNDIAMLPDSIWLEIATGRRCSKLGWYWRPEQVHQGEATLRPNLPDDFELIGTWDHASASGKRVAVLDVPYVLPPEQLNGVQLREWGTHGPAYGPGSYPEGLLEELVERHGAYPLPHSFDAAYHYWGCDSQDGSTEALLPIPRQLREAIEVKARVFRDVLDRERWDLFFGMFAEAHCAGHQLWHFFDESSPWHEPNAPEELRTGVRDTYVQLDASLAHLLKGAGTDATVLVLLSHGMGPHIAGWQLLPELMVRLGYGSADRVVQSVRSRLPRPVRQAIRAVLPQRVRTRMKDSMGISAQPFELPLTRAAAVRDGFNGAIRVNLKGRDPMGQVEPGAEYDAICDDLIQAFEELRDRETGEPVVTAAVRTDDVYGTDRHPNLPDVIVQFRRDRPVWSVTSKRVGTVTEPARNRELPRSGDHTPNSRVWAVGPGIEPGPRPRGNVLDLSPTILRLLEVPVPGGLEGRELALGTSVVA